jgi:UDP-N-acetylmuramate--alanine ligase
VPRAGGFSSPVKLGQSDLLVAEVDESDASFLLTRPVIAVLTNADPEHLDYYGSRGALLDAFVDFANSVPFWGAAILGIDHPGIAEIATRISARCVRFGFDADADLRAESTLTIAAGQRCRARIRGEEAFEFTIPLPGAHNILNALAAIAVGRELEVPLSILIEGLASFPGVSRRFELKGSASGIEVIDDYAHHPAEITATLRAARSVHAGRIVVVFQPHRFTRTRDCWTEFQSCFGGADRVLITEVYAASEKPIPGFDGSSLARAIADAGHPDAQFGGGLETLASALPGQLEEGDLVLTLGAGDIFGLGPKLLEALQRAGGGQA